MSKRPWKGNAKIERVELRNGDVFYETLKHVRLPRSGGVWEWRPDKVTFQSLTDAEASLETWWADHLARREAERLLQEKSRRAA